MKTGIYKIECVETGYCYIGQSKNTEKRFRKHKSDLKCGRHWNAVMQQTYNEAGCDGLRFDVIEECAYDKLGEREAFWINAYLKAGRLLNVITSETQKISFENVRRLAFTPEAKAKRLATRHRNGVVKHTLETRAKLSVAMTARRKQVFQFDLETGEIVNVWPSVKAAVRAGFDKAGVSSACNRKQYSHRGFGWSFRAEDVQEIITRFGCRYVRADASGVLQ